MSAHGDLVFIRGLRVATVIGVYEWERHVRQELVFDIEMAADNRRAAARDDVADALDYAAVGARVTEWVEGCRHQLIETLAEEVAALVLAEFPTDWLRLRLEKPGAVADASSVGVCIERWRGD